MSNDAADKCAVIDGWPSKTSSAQPFGPKAIRDILDAIVALNEQLLDALGQSARLSDSKFPLPKPVRAGIAKLSEGQRRKAARCGVLLGDVGFSDLERWQQISRLSEHEPPPDGRGDWLPSEDSIVLAHATLTVAWYVVQTAPAAARVLLGMTDEVLAEFRTLGVGSLALIARRRTHWVRPRWPNRVDIWLDVAALQNEVINTEFPSAILRCLKASAGCSPRLQVFVETSI